MLPHLRIPEKTAPRSMGVGGFPAHVGLVRPIVLGQLFYVWKRIGVICFAVGRLWRFAEFRHKFEVIINGWGDLAETVGVKVLNDLKRLAFEYFLPCGIFLRNGFSYLHGAHI